jgi:hypothetical protein
MNLLFELATWHALAKLRLHTESTIDSLEHSTTQLGKLLRRFVSTTCKAFDTRELPSEEAAQARRKAALVMKPGTSKGRSQPSSKAVKPRLNGRKTLSLNTYKIHALGAYVNAIRTFGTTDNYTTQAVWTLKHLTQLI